MLSTSGYITYKVYQRHIMHKSGGYHQNIMRDHDSFGGIL